MYSIWLEWDFGQENTVFKTKKAAMQWLQEVVLDEDSNVREEFDTVEKLLESGLASIKKVDVIG